MEQYKLELSEQGRENVEETIATLMEAAQEIANSSEKDFEHMKSKKWYKRLWELVTYSKDNEKMTARGVQNLAKLNEIVMKAIVILARYSADTAALVSESLNKIENLERSFGTLTAGLSKVATEVKKLKYNYKKSLSIEDLKAHDRDIVGSIFFKYVKQCREDGIMPNTASQKLYSYAMEGDTPEDDIDISTHLDLLNGDVQQLLYRLTQSYYYLIQGEFDESEYFDDFDISNKNMRTIKQQIENAVMFSGAENYADTLVEDESVNYVYLDGIEIIKEEAKEENTASKNKPNSGINDPELLRAEDLLLCGNYLEAYDIFEALANNGNSRAMYFFGEFKKGVYGNVSKDEGVAKTMYRKGYMAGDPLCGLMYADMLSDDEQQEIYGELIDDIIAIANDGDVFAQNELALCYERGKGVEKNPEESFAWYKKAAEQGYSLAQNHLAGCYYNGFGVEKNENEGKKWYRSSAELGNRISQNRMGVFCENENNIEEAVEWYKKSAEQGYSWAQYNLGKCYYNGNGINQNYEEAVKWYNAAAEQGNATAQNSLGDCYYDGNGVNQDYAEAVKWYKKSADQEDKQAQYNLGYCYYNGKGIEKNYDQAVWYYEKSANQGHQWAQYELGCCWESGLGVYGSNKDMAKHYYQQAADQGNEKAKERLMNMGNGAVDKTLDGANKLLDGLFSKFL